MLKLSKENKSKIGCVHGKEHSKMKRVLNALLCGVMVFALACPALAAEALQVGRSRQKFYMDGDPVQMEAYNINGSNYVKLDDLSKLVGFELSFDGKTNSVYIGEQPQQNDVVVIPQSDARLNLKEGDKVLCDDGYIYEITDMKRYDKSMFAWHQTGNRKQTRTGSG